AAPVEDRAVAIAFSAPVEDRTVLGRGLVPAPVEERFVALAFSAPVEERLVVAQGLVPAPVESRYIAPAPMAPVEERIAVAVVRPARQPALGFAPVQVASAAPIAMVVVAQLDVPGSRPMRPAPVVETQRSVVSSAEPKPRLIQQMFDRRGGSFLM